MLDRSKRPRDLNQLAKFIVDTATGTALPPPAEPQKNPAAVALGKLGGKKGGPARAAKLSAAKRKEIAKKAAAKRWGGDEAKVKRPNRVSRSYTLLAFRRFP